MKELLERLGYVPNEKNRYTNPNTEFRFIKDFNYFLCYSENGVLLFKIEEKVSKGTLIVLLQEYRIINERYIYESVEAIEEMFEDNFNDL